jgi:hypothetical protein
MTAAILIDKFHAASFKSSLNNVEGGPAGLTRASLQLMHGYNPNACFLCQVLLIPT